MRPHFTCRCSYSPQGQALGSHLHSTGQTLRQLPGGQPSVLENPEARDPDPAGVWEAPSGKIMDKWTVQDVMDKFHISINMDNAKQEILKELA